MVWALNRHAKIVKLVEAPGSTSPNLAAQSGVFTVAKPVTFPEQEESSENDLFLPTGLQHQDTLYQAPLEPFVLERITLGIEQAGELLMACELLGISGATLFPGYEGISRKVRDWANAEHKGFDPEEISIRDLW
ncbi:hypothetical protein QWY79_08270 [Halomonas sabkhae]|uniref:hypothetical protein n=1 Tax=Halomonas sabkhae TaxID=626223 RepID=UPI0025B472EE|nr:hypothetical protein [Halomonas sabkhae]MDN3525266.1 hypothetical protein [Halomonas sabkhae]